MPAYGEVIYTPRKVYVASLTATGTLAYGTPVAMDYVQKVSYDPESDTDEIMADGAVVESLAVLKQCTGEIELKALQHSILTVIASNIVTTVSDGTAPARASRSTIVGGGKRYPYFGMIVEMRAGGDASGTMLNTSMLVGFPKCEITNLPAGAFDQNKFASFTIPFRAIALTAPETMVFKIKTSEGADSAPTTASLFASFFTTA